MKLNFLSRVFVCAIFMFFITANIVEANSSDLEKTGFYGKLNTKVFVEKSEFNKSESNKNSYTFSNFRMGYNFANGFSVISNLKFNGTSAAYSHRVGDEVKNDGFFEDTTFKLTELKLNYENDDFNIYLGKFTPIIGFSYLSFPGLYGYQLAEEYALLEKVGLGAGFKFYNDLMGNQKFDVAFFSKDTTILSDSFVNSRHQNHRKNGGVGNNEDLSSYAVSLGGDLFQNENFYYRLGHAVQKKSENVNEDETRYSFSVGHNFDLTSKLKSKYLVEYMYISHLGGESNHDRSYFTQVAGFDYEKYNFAISYAMIDNNANDTNDNHDGYVFFASAGYQFTQNIGFDLGYKESDMNNEEVDSYTVALTYKYDFN